MRPATASKFGGPNPSVPVNGWPSLVAKVVPKGVVLAIDGLGGSKDKLITGVCFGGSEEGIDKIVCRFISKGGKSKAIIIDAVSPDRLVRRSG
jgi:hypothetical protein